MICIPFNICIRNDCLSVCLSAPSPTVPLPVSPCLSICPVTILLHTCFLYHFAPRPYSLAMPSRLPKVQILVNCPPTFLMTWLPGRYDIKPRIWKAVKRSRTLGSMLCLTLLLVAMIYREDTHTLTYLKQAVISYYLSLVPPHPDGLDTTHLWDLITQLVTAAVLTQNITHNGTFKGVVSLRQFRLRKNQKRYFFPSCDFSSLDQAPLEVPNGSKVPSAYRYESVHQMGQVYGQWCPYPPEGYNVYLGDLMEDEEDSNGSHDEDHETKLGVDPKIVLKECLEMLDDLQKHSWVNNLTMALLLMLLTVQPGTVTPTGITIIFENPAEDEKPSPQWWSSYTEMALDLRPSITMDVLLPVFLVVHFIFTLLGTNVSIALIRSDLVKAAKRCMTLATAVHVTILALHATAIYLHFTSRLEAVREVARYEVSFDMRFNPDNYEHEHHATDPDHHHEVVIGWNHEFKNKVRRFRLAHILERRTLCWVLLSIEVMLYLISFIVVKQYYNYTVKTTMRTVRSGILRAMIIVGPLLGITILGCYLIHRSHPTLEEEHYHTFAGVLKETVNNLLGTDKDADEPKTKMEWLMGAGLVVVGVVLTLFLWGIHEYISPDERRAMRTQRLPLHPL